MNECPDLEFRYEAVQTIAARGAMSGFWIVEA